MALPDDRRWLFWKVDFEALEPEQHADYILARILELGRLVDVRWAMATYGPERIHRSFREVAHPEISAPTRSL